MKPALYQIIVIAIALFFIIDRFIKFTRHEQRQSAFKFVVITFLWIGILLFILFPNLAHLISKMLGMGENLNTFIFIGFIIVCGLIYKLLTVIERMEKEIIEIVRNDALKKLKNNK